MHVGWGRGSHEVQDVNPQIKRPRCVSNPQKDVGDGFIAVQSDTGTATCTTGSIRGGTDRASKAQTCILVRPRARR